MEKMGGVGAGGRGGGGNGEQKVQAEGISNVMRFLLSGSFFVLFFSFELSRRNRIIFSQIQHKKERINTDNT